MIGEVVGGREGRGWVDQLIVRRSHKSAMSCLSDPRQRMPRIGQVKALSATYHTDGHAEYTS